MKIRAEYQAMGMYVADDLDGDPEDGLRGVGKSPEEAIDELVEQLIEAAENRGYKAGHADGMKEAMVTA